MNVTFKPCVTEDDFANVSLFFLARKLDLHPSFSTLKMVSLIYSYITQGFLYQAVLPDGRIVAAAAYYLGTPHEEFADKQVALIDIVIMDSAYRGTRVFLNGLQSMIEWIRAKHPEVEEVRLAALSENAQLCKLYSKFASFAYKQEGTVGEETVFAENITQMGDRLNRFSRI